MHTLNESGSSGAGPESGHLAWSLDWNLLRTYLVIVEEGSITAAARRLQLKQPSVSNALKRLEANLGQHLIERGPRSFELTPQGRALYQECAGILGSVNRLPYAFEKANGELDGTVHVALASHVVSPLVDDTLAQFHRRHPKTCVSISVSSSQEAVRSVFEKRAAVGICLVNEQLPELDYRLFYREHFGFFCGPQHPLFGREDLSLEDLRGEHCVSFHTDQLNDVLQPIAILRAEAGADQNISGISSNLEEVRRMVISGMGIGALPIHVVERDVRDGLLHRLPPYDSPPAIDIWLLRHRESLVNRAEAEFIRMLDRTLKQVPEEQRIYGLG